MPNSLAVVLLLLCCWVQPQKSFAQFKTESLTGPGRPQLASPDSFALALKEKANNIIIRRIGERKFFEWVDTAYRYPHYYNNVYYNNAPSEQQYRVFFRMRPNGKEVYEIELGFKPHSLELSTPVEEVLPDCILHPARCSLIDQETVQQICRDNLKQLKEENPAFHLSYRTSCHCFVWEYSVQKLTQYPIGIREEILLNAASGKVISRKLDDHYYMGR